jgi:SAM-dependent methyltransferase
MSVLRKLRGTELKTRLLNPHEEYWDRKLGIRTFGYHPGGDLDDPAHANYYMPTSYFDLLKIFKRLALRSDDIFVDLGSGMGRAVFLASHLGVRKSIGVELVPSLHETAEANRRGGDWPNVEFHLGDAREKIFPDVTLLWMFNPFGPAIMKEMLAKLQAQRTGQLRIIYLNPLHDEVLERAGWLQKADTIPRSNNLFGTRQRFDASIWQSR